ncbi:hypothetical protein AB0I10_15345 [Streptomyces sp. NPDC050636]|uniref:hypothetical protein n=1 Tax=Streptomyces sp. NPDC050636 TaxID=3154510 RepID=UPI00341B7A32
MRLRHTVATAVGALALVLALPTSASAAAGNFTYVYTDPDGARHTSGLIAPPSQECINLPGATDEAVPPADTPRNDTDATVTVFSDADCEGDYFTLRPNGGHASARLKLRSVAFS